MGLCAKWRGRLDKDVDVYEDTRWAPLVCACMYTCKLTVRPTVTRQSHEFDRTLNAQHILNRICINRDMLIVSYEFAPFHY